MRCFKRIAAGALIGAGMVLVIILVGGALQGMIHLASAAGLPRPWNEASAFVAFFLLAGSAVGAISCKYDK